MPMRYVYTGGDTDGYWVDEPDPIVKAAPAVASGMFSPSALGYNQDWQNAFSQAGITELPEYMRQFSSGGWNFSDLIPAYQTVRGADPSQLGSTGKGAGVLGSMGWSLGDGGLHYVGNQPIVETRSGELVEVPGGMAGYTPSGTTWGAGDQDVFENAWLRRKLAPNEGGWNDTWSGRVMGIGSILSMALAPYAAGAGAAADAGLAATQTGNVAADMAAAGMLADYGGSAAAGVGSGAFSGISNIAPVAAETAGAGGLSADSAALVGGYAGDMASSTPWYAEIQNLLTNLTGGGVGVGASGGGGMNLTDFFSSTGGFGDYLKLATVLGSGIFGGIKGNESMQDAINSAERQAGENLAFQKWLYDQTQGNYAPFRDVGVQSLSGLLNSDPTGGSGKYLTALEGLGGNFKFDENDPAYKTKVEQSTRAVNQALAARGMYNSRAGLNMLDESTRNILAEEYDKQYQRKYSNLMDLYNMSSKQGLTDYNKLLDLVKIGSGASSSAGSAAVGFGSNIGSVYNTNANLALESGKSNANLWSGLGSMPMNYLLLSSILGKK